MKIPTIQSNENYDHKHTWKAMSTQLGKQRGCVAAGGPATPSPPRPAHLPHPAPPTRHVGLRLEEGPHQLVP